MKAILWDLGGVFATNPFRLFIREFSIKNDIPIEKVVKAFKLTLGKWLEGKVTEEEHWKSFLNELNLPVSEEEFVNECKEQVRFFAVTEDDVLNYIKEIKKQNDEKEDEDKIKLAIASNNPKELGAYLNEEYGLGEIFDISIYSGTVGAAKPQEAFFKKVLDELELEASDCIFVDDKEKNIDAAEEMGMTGILFKDLNQLKEAISSIEVKK